VARDALRKVPLDDADDARGAAGAGVPRARWTSTSTDYRLYGLVGSHISLVDVGRVQFFGPPGVILLSVPDASGGRAIRVGYTWGMSVRLKDLRLLSPTTNVTLFLTVTKVWVTGNSAYDRLTPGGYDIAGFSLAPRKHTQ
jgi:hypothetical protein